MSRPATSVIVPVFNGAPYLAEALRSVLAQLGPQDELLVVDDGSTDASREIAESSGPPVRVLAEPHRGPNAARNAGLRAARGEFLAFLDADDLWLPGRLERQHALLAADARPCVVFGAVEQFISPDLTEAERAALQPPAPLLAAPHVGAMLARRAAFDRTGPFNDALTIGDFLDWYARATEAGLAMMMDAAPVMRRRIHANNTTRRRRAEFDGYLRVLKQSLDRRRGAASPANEQPR